MSYSRNRNPPPPTREGNGRIKIKLVSPYTYQGPKIEIPNAVNLIHPSLITTPPGSDNEQDNIQFVTNPGFDFIPWDCDQDQQNDENSLYEAKVQRVEEELLMILNKLLKTKIAKPSTVAPRNKYQGADSFVTQRQLLETWKALTGQTNLPHSVTSVTDQEESQTSDQRLLIGRDSTTPSSSSDSYTNAYKPSRATDATPSYFLQDTNFDNSDIRESNQHQRNKEEEDIEIELMIPGTSSRSYVFSEAQDQGHNFMITEPLGSLKFQIQNGHGSQMEYKEPQRVMMQQKSKDNDNEARVIEFIKKCQMQQKSKENDNEARVIEFIKKCQMDPQFPMLENAKKPKTAQLPSKKWSTDYIPYSDTDTASINSIVESSSLEEKSDSVKVDDLRKIITKRKLKHDSSESETKHRRYSHHSKTCRKYKCPSSFKRAETCRKRHHTYETHPRKIHKKYCHKSRGLISRSLHRAKKNSSDDLSSSQHSKSSHCCLHRKKSEKNFPNIEKETVEEPSREKPKIENLICLSDEDSENDVIIVEAEYLDLEEGEIIDDDSPSTKIADGSPAHLTNTLHTTDSPAKISVPLTLSNGSSVTDGSPVHLTNTLHTTISSENSALLSAPVPKSSVRSTLSSQYTTLAKSPQSTTLPDTASIDSNLRTSLEKSDSVSPQCTTLPKSPQCTTLPATASINSNLRSSLEKSDYDSPQRTRLAKSPRRTIVPDTASINRILRRSLDLEKSDSVKVVGDLRKKINKRKLCHHSLLEDEPIHHHSLLSHHSILDDEPIHSTLLARSPEGTRLPTSPANSKSPSPVILSAFVPESPPYPPRARSPEGTSLPRSPANSKSPSPVILQASVPKSSTLPKSPPATPRARSPKRSSLPRSPAHSKSPSSSVTSSSKKSLSSSKKSSSFRADRPSRYPFWLYQGHSRSPSRSRLSRSPSLRSHRQSRSSSLSGYYSISPPKRRRLASPPQNPVNRRLFEKYTEEELHLESFYCPDCQLQLNSLVTYETHMNGKRHKKTLQALYVQDLSKGIESSNPVPYMKENVIRRNQPPPGKKWIPIDVPAIMQKNIDCQESPMPGISHVLEIRAEREITYFCKVCDAPCAQVSLMPHLQGYKHQLNCSRDIDPAFYERNVDRAKKQVEKHLRRLLIAHERKYGRERLQIVREIDECSGSNDNSRPSSARGGMSDLRMLLKHEEPDNDTTSEMSFDLTKIDHNMYRDFTYGDIFCTLCESHMNNTYMWEAHIRGKRHLKAVKKDPYVSKSKAKMYKLENKRSNLEKEIEYEDGLIVGLDYIRETQNETGEMYNCYLCGSVSTNSDIISHLISLRHKTKYLERLENEGFQTGISCIKTVEVGKENREALIDDVCRRALETRGLGKPEVYVSKV